YFLGKDGLFFKESFVYLKNIGILRQGFTFGGGSHQFIVLTCLFKCKFAGQGAIFIRKLRIYVPAFMYIRPKDQIVLGIRYFFRFIGPYGRITIRLGLPYKKNE